MSAIQIIGRSSSHFTRVTRVFAHELGVPYELVAIHDITAVDPTLFGDNPALKLPTLRRDGSHVFGAENICRALADGSNQKIIWPEHLRTDLSRNAQELVWHGMAAQVQLVFGTMVNKLPADNQYFVKGKAGFEGALGWLEANLKPALDALGPRDLSLLEVTLFCLIEHIQFRQSVSLKLYPSLVAFAKTFGERDSAKRTPYRFDDAP